MTASPLRNTFDVVVLKSRVPFAHGTMDAGLFVFEIGAEDGERIAGYRRVAHMRSLVRKLIAWLQEHSGGSQATALFFEALYRHGIQHAIRAKDVETPKVVRRFVYESNVCAQLALGRLLVTGTKRGLHEAFSPTFLNKIVVRDRRLLSPFQSWRRTWTGALAVSRIEWAFAELGLPVKRASLVDDRAHATDLVAEGDGFACAIQVKGTARHSALEITTFLGPPGDEETLDVRHFYRGVQDMADRYGGPWVPLYIEVGLESTHNALTSAPPPWIREDPWLPQTILEILRTRS